MPDLSRRRVFGLLAGVAAAPLVGMPVLIMKPRSLGPTTLWGASPMELIYRDLDRALRLAGGAPDTILIPERAFRQLGETK